MANDRKAVRKARKGDRIRQVAAIPFRLACDGEIEIMLVTSCTTGRFIVPKGWPMKGKSGCEAAAIEASEEAGIGGTPLKEPAGTYRYWKRLSNQFVPVDVTVFLLAVDEVHEDWKEAGKRRRAWLRPEEAATLVDEPELSSLLSSLTAPEQAPVPHFAG